MTTYRAFGFGPMARGGGALPRETRDFGKQIAFATCFLFNGRTCPGGHRNVDDPAWNQQRMMFD